MISATEQVWLPAVVAAGEVLREVVFVSPIAILALSCYLIEYLVFETDRSFTRHGWFSISCILLIVANIAWSSWMISTPVENVVAQANQSLRILATIGAFVAAVVVLLIWTMLAGARQVHREINGAGVGLTLLRLSPLVPLLYYTTVSFIRGNEFVGDKGLLDLITSL